MRWLTALKMLVAAAALGGGVYAAMPYLDGPPTKATASGPESRPKVDVIHARRTTLAQRLVSNATLEAFEEADLFAKVSGYLSDVRVDIGDHVKSGQLLAIADVPEMDQELAESVAQLESRRRSLEAAQRQVEHNKADLALQEVTFKRQYILNKDRWVSDQALDEIRAKADVAKADVQLAEANRDLAAAQVDLAAATVEKNKALLAYAKITAPFDGVIAMRRVNRGDLVQVPTASRTTPLFRIERIDIMRVFCDVPENEVALVRVGARATVRVFGLGGGAIVGAVTRFAFRLDPETRNMRTEIDLPNPSERLYPGMYAEVTLELERHDDALAVPVSAVDSDANGTFVPVVKDGRIERNPVKIGIRDGAQIEVTEGLSEEVSVLANAKAAPPAGTMVEAAAPPG
jgi:multidrug efflux pump subunit AcrA (membrane-fusion protein)